MYDHSTTTADLRGSARRRAIMVAAAAVGAMVGWLTFHRCADPHAYLPASGHLQPGVEIYDTKRCAPLGKFLRHYWTWFPPLGGVGHVVLVRQTDGSICYLASADMPRWSVCADDPCLAHPCPAPEITKQYAPAPVGRVPWSNYVPPRGRLHPGVALWKGKRPAQLQPFGTFLEYDPISKNGAGRPTLAYIATVDGRFLEMACSSIEESGDYWLNPFDPCSESGFEVYCSGVADGATRETRSREIADGSGRGRRPASVVNER